MCQLFEKGRSLWSLNPPKKLDLSYGHALRILFIMTILRKTYPRKKNNKHHYPKPPSTNRGVELFDLGRVTFIKLSNPHVGSTCENRMGCTVWPVPACSHSTSSSYAGLENTVGCVAKPKKTLMYYLRMVCEQFVPSTSDTFGGFWRWVHNIRDFFQPPSHSVIAGWAEAWRQHNPVK